jgi:hypothetical protein
MCFGGSGLVLLHDRKARQVAPIIKGKVNVFIVEGLSERCVYPILVALKKTFP